MNKILLAWIGIVWFVGVSSTPAKDVITPQVETITMTAVGDIMMHKEQIDGGLDAKTGTYQFDYMFDQIKPYIEKADIAIGNLETTLAGKERGYTGYPAFNAPEQLARALKNTGFDLVTTANNHCLDRRYAGAAHTLEVLDAAGLVHTGTSRTKEESEQVVIQNVKGIKMAFMAYTYGTNGIKTDQGKAFSVNYLSKEKMKRDIALAKKQGADMICVSMHFGEEYQRQQNKNQQQWVDFLFSNGVDIVLGSHPHVLQPMVLTKDNQLVIYSLGNFVSSQTSRYRDSSILLNLTISKNFETGKTTIDTVDYIPIWTDFSRVEGKAHVRVLPVEASIDDYKNKNDHYLTGRDYKELKESLSDTVGMYQKPEIIESMLIVRGESAKYQTVTIDGQMLVELRALSHGLGIPLIWDEASGESALVGEKRTITLKAGSRYIREGEESVALSVAPRMIQGKTFVPLRGIAEALDYQITYDAGNKAIIIETV